MKGKNNKPIIRLVFGLSVSLLHKITAVQPGTMRRVLYCCDGSLAATEAFGSKRKYLQK